MNATQNETPEAAAQSAPPPKKMKKSEVVRAAIKAGKTTTTDIIAYAKAEFDATITSTDVANTRKQDAGAKAKASAPKASHSQGAFAQSSGVLQDAVANLCGQYGTKAVRAAIDSAQARAKRILND